MANNLLHNSEAQRSVKTMIYYSTNTDLANGDLNALFADAWPNHAPRDLLASSGAVVLATCVHLADGVLVGFVNVAWDGGVACLLARPHGTPRFPEARRRRPQLVCHAVELARSKGVEWLHVDYEARLTEFFRKCGFRTTEAGLMNLEWDDTATLQHVDRHRDHDS
jgi:hypothetical protein